MDGAFLEQNAEAIDAEVDEYYRELFKIQKVFNQKVKKMQMEREEIEREKKKKRRLMEEDGVEIPTESEDEDALKIPEAVNIINSTMDSIKEFKVWMRHDISSAEIIKSERNICQRSFQSRKRRKISMLCQKDLNNSKNKSK